MNQDHLFIRFVLNRSKTNKNGICPIYCRITYARKRAQFSTSEFVNPNNWNSKKQRLTTRDIQSQYVNAQLEIWENKIKKEYLRLQIAGENFDVDDLAFNIYKDEKEEKETYVVAYFQQYLKKLKKLVDKDIELGTWKKYDYSCKHAANFIKWKFNKRDYPIRDLKLQFLHDFEYYLKTEANHNQATLNKIIQRFRKPIRIAVGEGILDKDPFYLYKANRVKKEVVFLSVDELSSLEKHRFVQKRLEIVRDLFVFCCYTGLAYNEMNGLGIDNLVNGFDGKLWIRVNRKKTGGTINIPLLPKALEIIEIYQTENQVLPRYSNQKINSYLKEIADIVGINKRITHHTARKTFASTVLLYNDVPMEIVSELLGHSSIKITQNHYGKIVQKKLSACMKDLEVKLKQ
ncbi:MAG: site-specific integrase [Muricauda sp. TMED12]|nr:MAG: site-specific integrase [Muricauda sp. TMED12]